MSTPYISIIIPVYNVEPYLRDCLEPILNWQFADWEAILVDDGSPDGCGPICDEYAQKDARFKVVHKANGGVSSARNEGIRQARGTWILFIDGDDRLNVEQLTEAIKQVEMDRVDAVIFGIEDGRGFHAVPKAGYYEISADSKNLPYYGLLGFYCMMYRRELILRNKIEFPCNMKMAEDLLFMMMYHVGVKSVYAIDKALYYYNRHEGSATCSTANLFIGAWNRLSYFENVYNWSVENNIALPKWVESCFYENTKSGVGLARTSKFTASECKRYTQSLRAIRRKFEARGEHLFSSPYVKLAMIDIRLCFAMSHMAAFVRKLIKR